MTPIYQLMEYMIPVAMLISLVTGIYQLSYYRSAIAHWSGLALIGMALDLSCYFMLWTDLFPQGEKFLFLFILIGYLLLIVSFLVFVLLFTGHAHWVTRASLFWISLIPMLAVGLTVVGWQAIPAIAAEKGSAFGISLQQIQPPLGVFKIVLMAYSNGVGYFSIVLLLRMLFTCPRRYRAAVVGLLAGISLILAAGLSEILSFSPLANLSILQSAVAINAIPIFLIVFAWKAAGAIPLSRQLFQEMMRDGYVILDDQNQVVDFNRAAETMLEQRGRLAVGAPFLERIPELGPTLAAQAELGAKPANALLLESQDAISEVMVYPIRGGRSQPSGSMVVFHNVTERDRLENALRRNNLELTRSNAFLSAMASLTLNLQTARGAEVILAAFGAELRHLGLSCFVALTQPPSNDLSVRYFSEQIETVRAIEKIIGRRVLGFNLDRAHFSSLYQTLGSRQIQFYPDEPSGLAVFLGNLPGWIMDPLLRMSAVGRDEASMVVPLIAAEKTIGLIGVWGHGLSAGDVASFQIFGSQIGWAIEKANLQEAGDRRLEELSHSNAVIMALSGVASQLDSSTELRQVLVTLGKELKKLKLTCMVGTLDEAKQNLRIEYLTVMEDIQNLARALGISFPTELVIPRRLWPTDKAVIEKTPFWDPASVGSVYRMFPFLSKEVFNNLLRRVGLDLTESACYLPLMVDEDVIGILSVSGKQLVLADIPALSIFANQVASAIKNARLFQHAQDEIAERTQAEARVRAALTEKEVLLKEVHHRVKNNLQVISSLLSLQAAEIADPTTLNALKEGQNRVRSMALIHEKLYQSNDLAQLDFAAYLQSLVNSVFQSYRVKPGQIELKIEAEAIRLDLDTAIPCGLMVNELVSNSIKYAFPQERAGTIQISCGLRPSGQYFISVRDDGIGLPAGLEVSQSPTLGLKLVTSLVYQIEGHLEVESTHGGARFEITFARPESGAE